MGLLGIWAVRMMKIQSMKETNTMQVQMNNLARR